MEAQDNNHAITYNSLGYSKSVTFQKEESLFLKLKNLKELYYEDVTELRLSRENKTIHAFTGNRLIFASNFDDVIFLSYGQKTYY